MSLLVKNGEIFNVRRQVALRGGKYAGHARRGRSLQRERNHF